MDEYCIKLSKNRNKILALTLMGYKVAKQRPFLSRPEYVGFVTGGLFVLEFYLA